MRLPCLLAMGLHHVCPSLYTKGLSRSTALFCGVLQHHPGSTYVCACALLRGMMSIRVRGLVRCSAPGMQAHNALKPSHTLLAHFQACCAPMCLSTPPHQVAQHKYCLNCLHTYIHESTLPHISALLLLLLFCPWRPAGMWCCWVRTRGSWVHSCSLMRSTLLPQGQTASQTGTTQQQQQGPAAGAAAASFSRCFSRR